MKKHQFSQLAAMVLVGAFTCASCKRGDGGTTQSSVVGNPDTQGDCDVTLSKDAPYSAKEFMQQLIAALNNSAKSGLLHKENLRDFLGASDLPAVMNGSLTTEMLGLNECSVTRARSTRLQSS